MNVISKTLKFTLGLAIGTAIGAAAVMLLAPQSGNAGRESLQKRIDEIVRAGKAAQSAREKELLDYWEQQTRSNT